MQKKYMVLGLMLFCSVCIQAHTDASLVQEPGASEQYEKGTDELLDLEFDEFEEFDVMINRMNFDDFPTKEEPSWIMKKIAAVGAAIYMKCRAINKWWNKG